MTTTETKVFSSPTASAFRKGLYTDEEMRLAVALGQAKVPFVQQKEFSTGQVNPRSREGLIQTYTVDFKVGDHLIVEVMGEGSSSDDEDRHAFLVSQGFKVLYVSNKSVNASPSLVAAYVRDEWLLSMLRETAA